MINADQLTNQSTTNKQTTKHQNTALREVAAVFRFRRTSSARLLQRLKARADVRCVLFTIYS